jgi:elongation factor 2
VAFGSAIFGLAFTLERFAKIYSDKFKVDKQILMKKLWGDNYYDPVKKCFTSSEISEDGKKLTRSFVQFIMDPIIKLMKNSMEGNIEAVTKMTSALNIQLDAKEKEYSGKSLVKAIFMKWLNAGDILMEMIVKKLPSPVKAQAYRTAYLYEGPQDDPCAIAMQKCDPEGPLMIYISKMVKSSDKGRFYAFGRVFSGTARAGQKVRIMGPNYVPGKTNDLFVKSIQRTVLMMAAKVESVTEVPCGNTIGLVGVDNYLVKSGTISDYDEAHNIRPMKYSVSPVVRVAVKAKNPQDLPKLIQGLQSLAKADSLIQCYTEDTGEHILAGCGELHLEVCIKELEREHAKIPIETTEPVVTYKETVQSTSSVICLSKSQNKHNRIYAVAEPLSDELCKAIDDKEITSRDEPKELSKRLADTFGWDINDAKKIWCFGPDETGPNVLVD